MKNLNCYCSQLGFSIILFGGIITIFLNTVTGHNEPPCNTARTLISAHNSHRNWKYWKYEWQKSTSTDWLAFDWFDLTILNIIWLPSNIQYDTSNWDGWNCKIPPPPTHTHTPSHPLFCTLKIKCTPTPYLPSRCFARRGKWKSGWNFFNCF